MSSMRRATRQGRHVLEAGRRPSLRRIRVGIRVTPGRIAATAAAILLGVFAAAGTAAGSFAYLNATIPVGTASTVTAGTSALTLKSGSDPAGTMITLPAIVWQRMLPGDVRGQTITVSNTGDTALAVSTSLNDAGSAWQIRVASDACPGTQLPGAALSTAPTAWRTIAAGGSATLCIQAVLPVAAPSDAQGDDPALVLKVDGVQIP